MESAPLPAADPLDARVLGVGLAGVKLGEDWYLRLGLSLALRFDDVQIAPAGRLFDRDQRHTLRLLFHAPLTFLVKDNPPVDEGPFRTREWDEPGDVLRLLRVIEYGTPYGGVYLRGGELSNVRIGHRTIVDNYTNTLNVDRFRWGVHGNLNTLFGGAELLVDDVARPRLMGARAFVRPFSFGDSSTFARRNVVGVSLFGDIRAPVDLITESDGRYVTDGKGAFLIARDQPTGVLGFDYELTAVQTERVSLTPYSDANVHLGRGAGWHLGTFFGWKVLEPLVVEARLEYRLLGEDYLPRYFGPLYDIERFAFLPVGDSPTRVSRLRWLQSGAAGGRRHGMLAELSVDIGQFLRLAGAFEDEEGPNNSTIWLYASLPSLRVVQFGAWYVNTRFDGAGGIFDFQNALAVVEARGMLTSWLYLTAQVNRRWQLDSDGAYQPIDDFAFGAGASFGF